MGCDYKFTDAAKQDLDDILYYISKKLDNPIAATNFMTKLKDTISNVTAFPNCGMVVENDFIQRKDIRKLPILNYSFYYQFIKSDNYILILRIIYGKRDPEQISREITYTNT